MSEGFVVEAPRSAEEFAACAALQKAGDPATDEAVPAWFLWELHRSGARVFAAFEGPGIAREPLGFVVALPPAEGDSSLRVLLYAVREGEFKGEVLVALYGALAKEARERGITGILWPFDPFDPFWAEFLIERCGGESRRYEVRRDRTGKVRGFRALAALRPSHKGPSSWKSVSIKAFHPINQTKPALGGFREPSYWNLNLAGEWVLLEIPSEGFRGLPLWLKSKWNEGFSVLEEYMDRGYGIVGFFRQNDRPFLVLRRFG